MTKKANKRLLKVMGTSLIGVTGIAALATTLTACNQSKTPNTPTPIVPDLEPKPDTKPNTPVTPPSGDTTDDHSSSAGDSTGNQGSDGHNSSTGGSTGDTSQGDSTGTDTEPDTKPNTDKPNSDSNKDPVQPVSKIITVADGQAISKIINDQLSIVNEQQPVQFGADFLNTTSFKDQVKNLLVASLSDSKIDSSDLENLSFNVTVDPDNVYQNTVNFQLGFSSQVKLNELNTSADLMVNGQTLSWKQAKTFSAPKIPNSSLLTNPAVNNFDQLKPYATPSEVVISDFVAQNPNQAPVAVTQAFAVKQQVYLDQIHQLEQNADLIPNIIIGMTNTYVQKIQADNKIKLQDILVNITNNASQKQMSVAVQFNNATKQPFTQGLKLAPHTYYAFKADFDYSKVSFAPNNHNQVVIQNLSIRGQQDIEKTVGQWNDVNSIYQINNNPSLLNVKLNNVLNVESPTVLLDKWHQTNFNDEKQAQVILENIKAFVNHQYSIYQNVFDGAQTIGDMLGNNVTVREFLLGLGAPLSEILNQFDVTRPYADLVRVLLSNDCTPENVKVALQNLIDAHVLPANIEKLLTPAVDLIFSVLKDKNLVDFVLSIKYEDLQKGINALLTKLGDQVPPTAKTIVDMVSKYFELVNQVATNTNKQIADLGILEVITADSVKAEIPTFLGQVKTLVPEKFGKLIDIIILTWNEISPNWTLDNVQAGIKAIFNPSYNGTPTKLSEVMKTGLSFTYDPAGTITKNADSQTFNLNQNIKIQFKEKVSFVLTSIKTILKKVNITTILEFLNVDLGSLGSIVNSLGSLGSLLAPTWDLYKDEGINVLFKDPQAMVVPTETGYNVIANQYVSVNFKQSFNDLVDRTIKNLGWFAALIAKPIIHGYTDPIANFYMGYEFSIDSPIYVNNEQLGLQVNNVYDGTNKFSVDNKLLAEIQENQIPAFIRNQLAGLENKQQDYIVPDAELTKLIKKALGMENVSNNMLHIQINLVPSYDKNATTTNAPSIANAWISIYFDQALLNTTVVDGQPMNAWTNNFVINGLNITNINTAPAPTPTPTPTPSGEAGTEGSTSTPTTDASGTTSPDQQ